MPPARGFSAHHPGSPSDILKLSLHLAACQGVRHLLRGREQVNYGVRISPWNFDILTVSG
jgi:hypothetical protein